MENEVQVVEEVAGVSNGNILKGAIIVLAIGAVIGVGFGVKKLIEKRKTSIRLEQPTNNVTETSTEE